MPNSRMTRTVVMNTLRSVFDRAAEQFRAGPDADHYFETLHAAMVALQYATRVGDALLAQILADTQPRYYVRDLCIHREQQRHEGRWDTD